MAVHSFDPEIAAKVGINAAVLYQNLVFWTHKNFINQKHMHDGYVWTYNSIEAWGKLFPYLTENQIRTALKKLVTAGLMKEGNYNSTPYDRTKWYGLPPEIHLKENENGKARNHKPIPDSKPDGKPDNTPIIPSDDDDLSFAMNVYNAMAMKNGLPQAQKLGSDRRRKLRSRLKDCGGIAGWVAAMEMVEKSDFLKGKNKDGWRADFDFLLQEKSFTRLMEGSYSRAKSRHQSDMEYLADYVKEAPNE